MPIRLPILNRALSVRADSLNEEKRTVDLVFATEAPADMWHWDIGDYEEILTCAEPACDLSRLRMGGALLREHNRDQQIGVIESAKFENGQGIATARFSASPLADQEFKDIKAGIRRNFSVAYRVKELTAEKVSDENGNIYRATSWEPLEISLVSVPADVNCQAIRSAKDNPQAGQPVSVKPSKTLKLSETMKRNLLFFDPEKAAPGGNPPTPPVEAPKFDAEAERKKLHDQMLANIRDINTSAAAFRKANRDVSSLVDKAINEGWTVDRFRAEAIATLAEEREQKAKPTPSSIEVIGDRPTQTKSLGQQVVESAQFKELGPKVGDKRSIKIETDVLLRGHRAAAPAASSMFAGVNVTQQQSLVMLGVQRLTILDLLSSGTIGNTSLKYPRENTLDTGAAEAVAEGGLKPRWDPDITVETADVKKIAVYTKVPDEMLADFPAFQSYVDNRLTYNVDVETERQILYGDGVGNNLHGIFTTTGIQSRPLGGDTKGDAAYNALTLIRVNAFFEPDGYVFNPLDWEQIKLLKDGNNQYFGGGPFYAPYGNGQFAAFDMLWGKPVVQTTAVAQGTALAGAFKIGAQYFQREGMRIETTNSNEDDFIHNLVAVRCEHRLALAVYRPSAFVEITGI